eukprot:365665-Chlamydomonas_euryale.AAC.20
MEGACGGRLLKRARTCGACEGEWVVPHHSGLMSGQPAVTQRTRKIQQHVFRISASRERRDEGWRGASPSTGAWRQSRNSFDWCGCLQS